MDRAGGEVKLPGACREMLSLVNTLKQDYSDSRDQEWHLERACFCFG